MITTIIFAIMLVLGIIIGRKRSNDLSILNIIGASLTMFSSCILFILLLMTIMSHATSDKIIQQNKIEYNGLCKRYEVAKSEYEDVSKSDVIADITTWNMKVYDIKYWTENRWTNWFNPKSIADNLKYIPLE